MICGSPITASFWVCASCERAYGLSGPWKRWPAWAKALARDELRERRYQATVGRITVSYDSAGIENLVYGESNDDIVD